MRKCAPVVVILLSLVSAAFSRKRSEQEGRKSSKDMEQMVQGVVLDEGF